ncbi:hypothetical protein BDV36DRAFT_265638 [Aspergillus pseudocaelatus]|uniref:Uncharacterized protein n=1 Tax=Aspergillus pseudocaelatus TaxID=1825620 RepID=A0ABQ6WB20_9EURO|nr:hypothetical protein BDV36DRAFT_265638 [Aspergillus pseudocaelatus]
MIIVIIIIYAFVPIVPYFLVVDRSGTRAFKRSNCAGFIYFLFLFHFFFLSFIFIYLFIVILYYMFPYLLCPVQHRHDSFDMSLYLVAIIEGFRNPIESSS